MICIKFDQKIKKHKKPKTWTFQVFLGFKKNLKNLGFFRSHFPALILALKFDILWQQFYDWARAGLTYYRPK